MWCVRVTDNPIVKDLGHEMAMWKGGTPSAGKAVALASDSLYVLGIARLGLDFAP